MKLPNYSHIYIEDNAEASAVTQTILSKLPKSKIIRIKDYKEIFNRPGQNFQIQKLAPKLVLANKKDHFLYKGSDLAPDFGEENFFYNSLVLNCPYNCDYCYLQGMYNSGNIVIFVNIQDFFFATEEKLYELDRIYLCLSYDTDLLGMESWIGYSKLWIEFARSRPNLILELRTKSANAKALEGIAPIDNLILAWTLSPEYVVSKFEKKTASLKARIRAIQSAIQTGWKVRICIDPILDFPGWKSSYFELVEELKQSGIFSAIEQISLGTFRMNKDYFSKIRKDRKNDSSLFLNEFVTEEGAVFNPIQIRENLVDHLQELLSDYKNVYKM
ncbi:MAG: DNA photolyase [Leptospira sp.]|nr:DNA photolyase [Leptospira sp.]NCS95568.1 DNA photolyase [Leptospira sp.]